MLTVKTKIDSRGFWYFLQTDNQSKFSFNYVALGAKGKFSSGEVSGRCDANSDWKFCEVGFLLLQVGVSNLQLKESESFTQPVRSINHLLDQNRSGDFSRRNLIKMTAASLLFGLTGVRASARSYYPGQLDTSNSVHHPYKEYHPYSDSYSPYFQPY